MKTPKILKQYKNGNVDITIDDNGTRVYENEERIFDFEFPMSMDCKITNQCPMGCPMCHEMSTPDGENGNILDIEFINGLHEGTEIAIGGGAVTSHPDLIPFLEKLKSKGIIPSITVHQKEYLKNEDLIDYLVENKLIYGLGISFAEFDDEFWSKALKNPNVVVHLIAGLHGGDVFKYFTEKNAKILILGYKDFGRGHDFKKKANTIINIQIRWLKNNIKELMSKYDVISFDNLALSQLEIKKVLTDEQWKVFYQGDDGTSTMYVDLVKQEFAATSTSVQRYPLLSNIEDMFKIVKTQKK